MLRFPVLLTLLVVPSSVLGASAVEVEDVVTSYEPANNGAGPLWCYGSPLIARDGDSVYVSAIETGKDVPPLCNTRWQLWHRGPAGWKIVQAEREYRQREPCPLALFPDGPVFLSVNPSTQPPGTKYGPCSPAVMQFDSRDLAASGVRLEPAWAEGTYFTDHSYRGFAADGVRRELLLLDINAQTGDQFVSFRDSRGGWRERGTIHFPIRSCYPQVALRDRAAHVMAIGDIVEPNPEWRKLKKEVTKQDWDYVFRRLFYASVADVTQKPFSEPIEVESVEATGGHISNCDLHVDKSGACHLLYIRRPHQHAFLRDKYFAGQPMTSHLVHVVVRGGKVESRHTLAETPTTGDGIEPAFARFHVMVDGGLCVVLAGTPLEQGRAGAFGNFFGRLTDAGSPTFERIALEQPFHTFFTNTLRGGSAPSDILDLFGTAGDGLKLRYARVRIR